MWGATVITSGTIPSWALVISPWYLIFYYFISFDCITSLNHSYPQLESSSAFLLKKKKKKKDYKNPLQCKFNSFYHPFVILIVSVRFSFTGVFRCFVQLRVIGAALSFTRWAEHFNLDREKLRIEVLKSDDLWWRPIWDDKCSALFSGVSRLMAFLRIYGWIFLFKDVSFFVRYKSLWNG